MGATPYRDRLKAIKRRIAAGEFARAFDDLREVADETADITVQTGLARLYDRLPGAALDLVPLRVAIVATSSVEHLGDVLRFYLARDGFAAEIFLADYDTLHQSVLDPASRLYRFEPEIVWLFTGHRDVEAEPAIGASDDTAAAAVAGAVDGAVALWDALRGHCAAHILHNNADLPLERPLGNFDGAAPWGRLSVLRRYNQALVQAARPGVTIFDLEHVSAAFGKRGWFDERYWHHSKHGFSLDAIGMTAARAARLIAAIKGRARKCLVLDLDDTLWGGVIGDDGLDGIRLGAGTADGEAFAEFQRYLLALKRRGVILAVCSKNEDENARAPFVDHPGMVLGLDDIAVFRANWDNKPDNIRAIAEILDIGLDSLVFIDDNPVERGLVRAMLPMVAVPEMPDDPSLYIRAIDREAYAEMIAFSAEDGSRAAMYRDNAARRGARQGFTDLAEFLRDLDMTAVVGPFDAGNLARVAQLINKSNQFHLTTTRYSEPEIEAMIADPSTICRTYRLTDRYGDNGLISLIILRRRDDGDLYVDTWAMSCRVLSRGVEEFVYNQMVEIAREQGCRRILGRFVPTRKNGLVAELYDRLGFALVEQRGGETLWALAVDSATPVKQSPIRRVAA